VRVAVSSGHAESESILVIKLGALGDFVLAGGPCAAIRAHHPTARIILLTSRPYVALAQATPWFDEIWVDQRPKLWQWRKTLHLRGLLRDEGFSRVYDLQTSDRSSWYFRLLGGRASGLDWSGIAAGCSHPHANPQRDFQHTIDRQAEQLLMAGIPSVPSPQEAWAGVAADPASSYPELSGPFALLVPGGAAHRPGKRWPADHYGTLAQAILARGLVPVLLGTGAEQEQIAQVQALCPQAISLCGRTGFLDLLALGRRAAFAVGNDTGPMHLLAAAGCACVVLFSQESNPDLCAPRGAVQILQRKVLSDLGVEEVLSALAELKG